MSRQRGDSFSNAVIVRILRVLLEHGDLKKSNLCSKSGLNYKVCTKYINFLEKLYWIEIRRGNTSGDLVRVSQEGIENLRKLEAENNDEAKARMISALETNHTGRGERQILDNQVPTTQMSSAKHKPPDDQSGSAKSTKKDLGKSGANEIDSGSVKKEKKRVVIVDDDENSLYTYKSFLESDESFQVTIFSDPRGAFEYITLHPYSFDLLVLDIRMPNLSGLRVFQGIKALNPAANIIFLSSLDAAPELSEILSDARNGAINFLRKPVSRINFINAVQNAVT